LTILIGGVFLSGWPLEFDPAREAIIGDEEASGRFPPIITGAGALLNGDTASIWSEF
jgi:hypothetical protein